MIGLILSFCVLLLVIAFTYLIGCFLYVRSDYNYTLKSFFLKTLLGTIVLTIVYALIKSFFTSVLVSLIVPFCYFLSFPVNTGHLRKLSFKLDVNSRTVLLALILVFVSFVYKVIPFVDFTDLSLKNSFYDFHFYSELARGLSSTGVESFFNRFGSDFLVEGTVIYHYFDLWLVSLISSTIHIDTYSVLISIIYPFFYFLTLLGIASFVESVVSKQWELILYTIVLSFASTFPLGNVVNIELFRYFIGHAPSMVSSSKILITYPLIFYSIHLYKDKKFFNAALVLIMCSVFYTTVSVIFIPALFILSLFHYYKTKSKTIFYLVGLSIASLIVHYFIFANRSGVSNSHEIIFLKSIKTSTIVGIEFVINFLVFYLPVLLVFGISLYSSKVLLAAKYISFYIFCCAAIFGSILLVSLIFGTPSSTQFMSNVMPCLMTGILVIVFVRHATSVVLRYFLLAIFVFNLYSFSKDIQYQDGKSYAKSYVEGVKRELTNAKSPKFLVYQTGALRWDYNFNELAQFTSKMKDVNSGINIAVDFTENVDHALLSPFGKWCAEKEVTRDVQSLVQFMMAHQVDYLFVKEKGRRLFQLSNLFVLVVEDKKNQEVLLRIKE